MTLYRSKSKGIEAMQWTGSSESFHKICDWLGHYKPTLDDEQQQLHLYVAGVATSAKPGDYIIKFMEGGIAKNRDDFEAQYEKVI